MNDEKAGAGGDTRRAGHAIWAGGHLPAGNELAPMPRARFQLIKAYEPGVDGYHWLKGVAIEKIRERWIASFGHNTGESGENNATEVTNARISTDDGRSWGPLLTIDAPEGELGTSHGVFLLRGDELWAFNGAFYGIGRAGGRVHTRAYVADARSIESGLPVWKPRGVVAWDGFWPLQEPILLENGTYLVGGASVGGGDGGNTVPAVGLVDADDPTSWHVVQLPYNTVIWGESTVVVRGNEVVLVSRSNQTLLKALVAHSHDYGRSWGSLRESNLPMANSKPYAGVLSSGRPYLINTFCGDVETSGRNPLSILVGDPETLEFRYARRLIDARDPLAGAEGYSHWAYPYAVERDGYLRVAFYMGTEGRNGSGAGGEVVIPVDELERMAMDE